MKVAFLGGNLTGRRCLDELIRQGQDIVGVFTIPQKFNISYSDGPVGVSRHVSFEDVPEITGAPLFYVSDGMKKEHFRALREMNPDLILVSGWYYMIPKATRDLAPYCLGMHPSLLPKYRGGAPLTWAIINGEKETGMTLFHLEKKMDAGDIVAQERVPITREDTIATLYDKIDDASVLMLEGVMPLLEEGSAPRMPQDHSQATEFPQRKPEDGLIDWTKSAEEIYNWIRAQTRPYPGAFTQHLCRKVKVWHSLPYATLSFSDPGAIIRVDPIMVSCGSGYLELKSIEPDFEFTVGDKLGP